MRTHKLLMSCPLTKKGGCSLHRSVNITACCEYDSNMPAACCGKCVRLLFLPILILSNAGFSVFEILVLSAV